MNAGRQSQSQPQAASRFRALRSRHAPGASRSRLRPSMPVAHLFCAWSLLRMSTRPFVRLTFAAVAALAISGMAWAQAPTARLGTFEKDSQTDFALRLIRQTATNPAQKNEVVIMVDTSASQAGRYRAEAMSALQSMLSAMGPNDRVQLMAVDMKAAPMSAGFVAPQGPEMQAALAKLNGRTP